MPIMPRLQNDPLTESRMIASAVLARMESPDQDARPRRMALNALYRLACAMQSHGFFGKGNSAYFVLKNVLNMSLKDATGLTGGEGWTRLQDALRRMNDDRGDENDRKIVRTMARSLENMLAAA